MADEPYWTYRSSTPTPSYEDAVRTGAVSGKMTETGWYSLTPGMRREIVRLRPQEQGREVMATEPIYFIHGARVCRGHIAKRLGGRQHRVKVAAENYVYADGTLQPISLDFTRVLRAEEYFMQPDDLLAVVAALPREEEDA